MSSRPGTVSKILWHFTGGPQWSIKSNKQLKALKPLNESYKSLVSILSSKELKVGNYQEIVKVIVPKIRKYNREKKTLETFENFPVTVKSRRVCCIADIPIQHLAYHANRYGKIAIGFHRDSIVTAGFNPVMYTLEDTNLLRTIYKGYSAIDGIDIGDLEYAVDSLESEIHDIFTDNDIDEDLDIWEITGALSDIEDQVKKIETSFNNFLAFIKTFDPSEFDSIYCEREWRSTISYKFTLGDIAIIVLPKKGRQNYFQKFINDINIPRTVTVASWEDLVEH